jgi:hypothetical protein
LNQTEATASKRATERYLTMTTHLDKPLRREILIKRKPYTVTLTPQGLKLTEKGRRKGIELKWADLVSGEAALAVALNASLAAGAARQGQADASK